MPHKTKSDSLRMKVLNVISRLRQWWPQCTNESPGHKKRQKQFLSEKYLLSQRGYIVEETIGIGGFSKVKRCYSIRLQTRVATKVIDRNLASDSFVRKFLNRELENILQLRHEHIIKTYEIFALKQRVYIVMELAMNGDMLYHLRANGAFPEHMAKRIWTELADAIDYLHKHGICHRDLKAENVLFDENFGVKLIDFGFSRRFQDSQLSRTYCGSPAYAPPEVLLGKLYNPRCYDLWSLGVVLYTMLTASLPFNDSNVKQMVRRQLEHKLCFRPDKIISENAKDLISNLLEPAIEKRFTFDQIWNHPWMTADACRTLSVPFFFPCGNEPIGQPRFMY